MTPVDFFSASWVHPGKLPQNRWHFAHRHSHPVMHGVGRRLHPQPHPMRRRPILIECHVRMLSAHPLSTRLTPAHLHRVTFDFWLGSLRHIGDRHLVGSFPPQFATATRALGDSHRHWLRRPIGRCGRRGAAESKPALAGLAPRPLSLRFPLGLAPSAPSPGRLQFLAQLLVLPAQPINLLLRPFLPPETFPSGTVDRLASLAWTQRWWKPTSLSDR